MNILMIGNGFDLAHGLPTKYTDFLKFVEVIRQVIIMKPEDDLNTIKWKNISPKIKEIIVATKCDIIFQKDMWHGLLDDNVWIDYFLQCNMYQKENWIDFESEISRVIQALDRDMKKYNKTSESIVDKISVSYLERIFIDDIDALERAREQEKNREIERIEREQNKMLSIGEQADCYAEYEKNHPMELTKKTITYAQLISRLESDLNKLIKALEIYVAEYIEKIKCDKLSPDIKQKSYDALISFNYTDTYTRLYGTIEKSCDYIHGKANNEYNIDNNNMVLGIDEYLSEEQQNKELDFIVFKKYYQRIFKGTGCEYKYWIDEIKESGKNIEKNLRKEYPSQIPLKKFVKKHYLYIYGYSLDSTDSDVLKELILNDNMYTTIYYHKEPDDVRGKKDLARKIINLVKIIGRDELIRRTGGETKTIVFCLQQDMK